MTRLITEWIFQMEETVHSWDRQLEKQTGLDFIKLASAVGDNTESSTAAAAEGCLVAVVPVTCGLGTISHFVDSVAAIVRSMGFDTFITNATDVNGLYEAHVSGADIVFMADDDRYIALNLKTNKLGDNNIATSKGYIELLENMAGSLENQEVAVLGYGIIGKLMAGFLKEKGADVSVYDKDQSKKMKVLADGHKWINDDSQLKNYKYIADGTSEGGWLSETMLAGDVLIAAPGVPLSLTESAQESLKGRYVHDFLEIGTVGMLGLVI